MDIVLNIIVFALILSFLVLIHELGHFLVARKIGIGIEEFGLGYPPRALILFKKWGTLFTLNFIPFGGFIKMRGEFASEDEAKEHTHGAFYSKSAIARLAVILAGATVNFIYGIIAFAVVFSFLGIPNGAVISEVSPNSPAASINLPVHVAITGMTGSDGFTATRSRGEVIQATQQHAGQEVTIHTVDGCDGAQCNGREKEYQVRLRTTEETPKDQGILGVALASDAFQFYPWYEMPVRGIVYGIDQAVTLGFLILQGLGTMVRDLVMHGVVPTEVAGPVGIVDEATQSGLFSQGIFPIILFSGMLSINLAIMNVLPIPALDGGRAVFILLEKIIGKVRVAKIEGYANYGGFAVLIVLIVLVTARDIFRIVHPGA